MPDPRVLAGPARRSRAGFTLIEVLMALFVFGLTFGLLQEIVSESLKKMADARDEITAGERGQQTLREFGERITRGENITNEEGDYEEPDGSRRFRYSVSVTPYQMALPRGVDAKGPPLSGIFVSPSAPAANADAVAPPIKRIVVRVFRKELGPESAQPLVSFLRQKPPEDEGADESTPNQDQPQGQDPSAQGVQDGISGGGQNGLSGDDAGGRR